MARQGHGKTDLWWVLRQAGPMLAAGPGERQGGGVPRGGQGRPEVGGIPATHKAAGTDTCYMPRRSKGEGPRMWSYANFDGVGVRGLPTAQWLKETVVVSVAVVVGVLAMVLLPHFHNSRERRKQAYNVT